MAKSPRLLVIGAGNMASALLRGAVDARVLTRDEVWAVEPDDRRRGAAAVWSGRQFAGAAAALQALEQLGAAGSPGAQILLAVKPQALDHVAAEVASAEASSIRGSVLISILAGTPRRRIVERFGGLEGGEGGGSGGVKCIRVMPNTPASVRRGISAIAKSNDLSESDLSLARAIFGAVGEVIEIDESLMDAFTAVAGSGPAYLFRFVEALAAAAEEVGFEPGLAARISRATITGASQLLATSDSTAADLRAAVTSKGGTTEAALRALDEEGFDQAVAAAVRAARDRGEELSR